MKKIIINADDFALNSSCTRAICEAFQKGFITDTTMVANGMAYTEAVECIHRYSLQNKVGIHFNLTDFAPITQDIKKCKSFCSKGQFHGEIQRLRFLSYFEKQAVYEELSAQIRKMENDGIHITHADSHHHIHTAVFIAPIVLRVCREHGIRKIRLQRNIGHINLFKRKIKNIYNKWLLCEGFESTHFFGSFEDMKVSEFNGNVEIMVHPDYNQQQELIDRKDYVQGMPEGIALQRLIKLEGSIRHTSYCEL